MLNKAILMGRLTATPVLNQTQGGAFVTSFTIAVDRRYQKQGELKQVDFITCVAWRNTAEFISKYFKKGEMIAVDGEIQSRRWDKPDGTKGYATEVIVNNVSFCGGKNNNEAQAEAPTGTTDIYDDDLPF